MAILNVNLTRIESINMKKSLKTAQKGHKLLKDKLDELIKKLLELVQNEKAIELISAEIEKTRRRVNAIENVTIPNYIDTIKYIQLKLSEDERASTSRLMKIKEMLVK